MHRGLIVVGHGARDSSWREPFDALAARLRAVAPATPLRLAFLELMEPDLEGAAAELIGEGVDAILIVPIFFGQGGHLRRDLTELLGALRRSHPHVAFECVRAAGEDRDVLEALVRYCIRSLESG